MNANPLIRCSVVAVLIGSGPVFAADLVQLRSGVVQTGEVVRVGADGSVELKIAIGQIALPRSDILRIEVAKPAAYDVALTALKDRKFSDAATGLRPIVERYAGLDVPWVQDALLKLGDAYVGMKQFGEAKKQYDAFGRWYPRLGGDALTSKYALVLVEQKDYAKAGDLLRKFLEPQLKKDYVTEDQEAAIADALTLLGDCERANTNLVGALDNYLLVVSVYNSRDDLVSTARLRAADVFEQQANWKRAKGTYDEVVKQAPNTPFANAAQKRLDALNKEHP